MKELISIQNELKCGKTRKNSFANFTYRNLSDILGAVKPLLTKYSCTLIINDDIIDLGGVHYVKSTATITNAEKENVETSAFSRIAVQQKGMNDSQLLGSTTAYSRKLCLGGLFLIDDSVSADSDNFQKQQQSFQQQNAMSNAIQSTQLQQGNATQGNFGFK